MAGAQRTTGQQVQLTLAIAVTVLLGIAMGPASASLLGTVHTRCPAEYLGRIKSFVGFSAGGLAPVSMIIFCQRANHASIPATFTTAGACLGITTPTAHAAPQLRHATPSIAEH